MLSGLGSWVFSASFCDNPVINSPYTYLGWIVYNRFYFLQIAFSTNSADLVLNPGCSLVATWKLHTLLILQFKSVRGNFLRMDLSSPGDPYVWPNFMRAPSAVYTRPSVSSNIGRSRWKIVHLFLKCCTRILWLFCDYKRKIFHDIPFKVIESYLQNNNKIVIPSSRDDVKF